MIRRSTQWLVLVGMVVAPFAASAGEPVVGVDLGAAVATKKIGLANCKLMKRFVRGSNRAQ